MGRRLGVRKSKGKRPGKRWYSKIIDKYEGPGQAREDIQSKTHSPKREDRHLGQKIDTSVRESGSRAKCDTFPKWKSLRISVHPFLLTAISSPPCFQHPGPAFDNKDLFYTVRTPKCMLTKVDHSYVPAISKFFCLFYIFTPSTTTTTPFSLFNVTTHYRRLGHVLGSIDLFFTLQYVFLIARTYFPPFRQPGPFQSHFWSPGTPFWHQGRVICSLGHAFDSQGAFRHARNPKYTYEHLYVYSYPSLLL